MRLLSVLRHRTRCGINLIIFSSLLINGCRGGDEGAPAPNIEFVQIASISSSSAAASLGGTAWVSDSYYASRCVGFACLFDTTRTDDYPGVDVTCVNLTTGAAGNATSYYGPGTDWVHRWYAGVPVVAGSNTIQISAYDPGGKGGFMTVEVVPPSPLTVLSTTPQAGAAGVLLNSTIAALFSGEIDPSSPFFPVNGPSGAVAGSRTVNGSTVTFTPSSYLAYNTTYTVTLPMTLRTPSGSSLISAYTWSFTTMAFPIFGVLSTYPAAGDTSAPVAQTVSATFNGQVDPMSISSFSSFVTSSTGARWGYSYYAYGSTVSVGDTEYLQANTTYTATLTAAVRDTSGHSLPFDYTWTFKTSN